MEILIGLGVALAVGLLIGMERGWEKRAAEEGSRIAGIRTFGLAGLLGGLWALLSEELGDVLLGLAFAAFAALVILAYIRGRTKDEDVGITTAVATLITFALGAIAVRGWLTEAAAGAVITATLLSMKPVLHDWLRRLEPQELYGSLKLLLISVVLLPVLPNQGFGPWEALNPYAIWWLVVLIAGISFAGYFFIKVAGARRGLFLTGLLGGLVSSTVVTINFSRLASKKNLHRILTAGILVACATMFPRILLEVAVVNIKLVPSVALPLGPMTVIMVLSIFWLWRQKSEPSTTTELTLTNPFQLGPAIKFGLLLAGIILLGECLRRWLGDVGIYLLAAVSGIADVDAITLSLSSMARGELAPEVATRAIVLAAVVNTLVKGVLAIFIAGVGFGKYVFTLLLAAVFAGGAALWFTL